MTVKAIRNIVHPKSVFALPKDKKSYAARNHIAQELSNTMKKTLQNIPQKELTLDKYKEILYKIIYPAKPDINFYPTPNFQEYDGKVSTRVASMVDEDTAYHVHMGYDIYLPLNRSGNITDKNIAIHESRHLFDRLCNPKYNVTRLSHLLTDENKKDITKKTLDYLVDTQFFNVPLFENLEMNIFQKRALKKLEQFSNADKIRILQTARYKVISELNAYTDIEVYSIRSVGSEVRKIDTLNLYKKREFIDQQLKKLIKEERALLSKQA